MVKMSKRPIRILLVEDNEDDYILTQELLRDLGDFAFDLQWVTQFGSALDTMRLNRHDVYLLDYHLGGQTGLDLLRAATEQGCKGPIILVTGLGDHEVDVEAMQAGAVDYLVKDQIDGPTLERSIRYAIAQKQVEADLIEMRQRLVDSREQERLYMAQELHDGPLQDLIGMRFHLGVLADKVSDESAHAQLSLVQGSLQTTIQTIRAMCGEMRPPTLAPFGLEQAIRAHAQQFQVKYPDIVVDLDLDVDGQTLPERVRLALFRIYQQAMANVAKHADANHVRVSFRLTDQQIRLKIIDDGYGFAVPNRWLELARDGHLGLLGAAERAEAIGGHLAVISSAEAGTTLAVTAPKL